MVDCACIIQARLNSRRLPGKISLDLCGKPLLARVIDQCSKVSDIDVVLATSVEPADDITAYIAEQSGARVVRGPLDDVRKRYLLAGAGYKNIIRVTADNPFTDPSFFASVIEAMREGEADYVYIKNSPYGSAIQGFTYDLLEYCANHYGQSDEREHVVLEDTLFQQENITTRGIALSDVLSRPDVRLTVDDLDDFQRAWQIMHYLESMRIENKLSNILPFYDENFSN